ncbi:hypothetical protein L2E82_26372 [Cichorium intybus]|uniref:Uncharacterized protein n=1 Tax=Cichorium intybus TaxID=13427 RepID=A0ACB9CQF9_CICIN|nr:hypothetical protein L2E82_26372 [Cichorium intybus]
MIILFSKKRCSRPFLQLETLSNLRRLCIPTCLPYPLPYYIYSNSDSLAIPFLKQVFCKSTNQFHLFILQFS